MTAATHIAIHLSRDIYQGLSCVDRSIGDRETLARRPANHCSNSLGAGLILSRPDVTHFFAAFGERAREGTKQKHNRLDEKLVSLFLPPLDCCFSFSFFLFFLQSLTIIIQATIFNPPPCRRSFSAAPPPPQLELPAHSAPPPRAPSPASPSSATWPMRPRPRSAAPSKTPRNTSDTPSRATAGARRTARPAGSA